MTKLNTIDYEDIEHAFFAMLQSGEIPDAKGIAKRLNIVRSSLYNKLEELGIDTMENLFVTVYRNKFNEELARKILGGK